MLSLVKTDKGYEIGKHHSLQYFAGSFYNSIGVPSLKLESFQLETYQLKEIAETEMLEELSAVEIIRIPTLHDSDFDYIEARFVYPFTYHFKFNGIEISRTEGYPLPNLDTISVEIIQALKPKVLKCCRNCTHFKYSGMSYDMSGGRAGYCNVFTERLDKEHAREAVTNIWQWCDHFKQNERI
ncbi:MAG: hypothetical protein IPK76_09735 [Lewinellaceae bacterium]|nr:hypothetical protein [Lewinellaceae bacterium]